MNAGLYEGLTKPPNNKALPILPACRVYNSVGLTHTASGAWQALSGFNRVVYDTDGISAQAATNGRLVINTSGIYVVGGSFEFAVNATGVRGILVYVNGNTDTGVELTPTTGGIFGSPKTISTTYYLNAGDYIELKGFQNSGGNLGINQYNFGSPVFHATYQTRTS